MDRFQRKRAVVAIKTIVCVAFLVLVVVCVMTFVLYFQAVRGLEMCEQRRVQTLYSLRHTGEQANSRERTVDLTVESVTKLKAPTVHECDCPRVTPAADGAINPIDKLKDTSDRVRVIVLTILKDGQSFGTGRTAEDYARLVSSLDYPDVDLSVGVLASDHEVLQNLRKTFKDFGRRLKSVSLFHRKLDSDNIGRDDGQRHAPSIQKKRRTMLARYRNTLISLALGKNDNFVLWIDADMKKIPESIIQTFIATKKQIVTVHTKRGKLTYDLNAWSGPRTKPSWSELRQIKNGGMYIPRPAPGAKHMDNFPYYGSYKGQKNDPVPLDSVGGTVLWVDANLHREGVIFPPFYLIGSEWDRNGYDGIETEGICYIAKAMLGNQVCFGLPSVVAYHTMN